MEDHSFGKDIPWVVYSGYVLCWGSVYTACVLIMSVDAMFSPGNTKPECVTISTSHVGFVDW